MSEKILVAISDASVCGSDYKYEDAFIEIEAEIDKTNSMLEGVDTDWAMVADNAYRLLCEQTKDTKIFCWWVYATWKKEGVSGLEKSLGLFSELLTTFEDKLFPKSKKVKLSSLMWLDDLLTQAFLDENGALQLSLEPTSFLELFSNVEKNFALCVQEEVSAFVKIKAALEREIKAQELKAIEAESAQHSSASSTQTGEISTDSEAAQALRALKKSAALLHEYYRSQNKADIKALRLVRLISWVDVDELPMNEDKKTPLNPPSAESISIIETLMDEENYEAAFDSLEQVLAMSPFWIEGHFMAVSLLEKMGETAAAKEVTNSLISFIKMDESILELSFRDTTPFASVKFKQWLSEQMGAISSISQDSSEDDLREEVIEQAYALAKKKQIKEAMALLQGAYVTAVNKEDKFHWRLVKAELAVEFGKSEVALALLEELKRDIDTYNLDEWKPELAAKVFSLYLNNFNRTQVDVEHINTAYARLCKIDIAQALEITI